MDRYQEPAASPARGIILERERRVVKTGGLKKKACHHPGDEKAEHKGQEKGKLHIRGKI